MKKYWIIKIDHQYVLGVDFRHIKSFRPLLTDIAKEAKLYDSLEEVNAQAVDFLMYNATYKNHLFVHEVVFP